MPETKSESVPGPHGHSELQIYPRSLWTCRSGSSASTVYSDTRDPPPTATTRSQHAGEWFSVRRFISLSEHGSSCAFSQTINKMIILDIKLAPYCIKKWLQIRKAPVLSFFSPLIWKTDLKNENSACNTRFKIFQEEKPSWKELRCNVQLHPNVH